MKTIRLMALVLFLMALLPAAALAECDHDFYMANVTKPSCESDGSYILKCSLCGYSKKEVTEGAWGHDWELTYERDASCVSEGVKEFECSTCHKTKRDTTPLLEHKWVDYEVLEEPTCTRDGSQRVYCSECGSMSIKTLKKAHKYGEWNVTEEATENSKGTRTRTCRVCKKKQTESYYPEGTLYKDIKGYSDEVKELQTWLTELGYLNDKIDGKFGKKTQAAVKEFQKEYGLHADGIAWPETLYALEDTVYGGILADGREEVACCVMTILEDGTICWEICDAHLSYETQAIAGLSPDAGEAERLNCSTVAWQTELDVLYQTWLENCVPEEQPMVVNHKTMFQGYLNSQQMVWNTQFGGGSIEVLEMINNMLKEQCYTLCPIVYGLQEAE